MGLAEPESCAFQLELLCGDRIVVLDLEDIS